MSRFLWFTVYILTNGLTMFNVMYGDHGKLPTAADKRLNTCIMMHHHCRIVSDDGCAAG